MEMSSVARINSEEKNGANSILFFGPAVIEDYTKQMAMLPILPSFILNKEGTSKSLEELKHDFRKKSKRKHINALTLNR